MNEVRFLDMELCELRADDKAFTGYAARFYDARDSGTTYRLSPNVLERIATTAFERTLREQSDKKIYFNHDSSTCMGRTNNNRSAKLTLWTDERGLAFSLPYNGDDPDARKCRAKIDSGAMGGCSFRFSTNGGKGERMVHERGQDYRELHDIDLDEVSMVINPAYTSARCQVRSADCDSEFEARYQTWKQLQEIEEFLSKYSLTEPQAVREKS